MSEIKMTLHTDQPRPLKSRVLKTARVPNLDRLFAHWPSGTNKYLEELRADCSTWLARYVCSRRPSCCSTSLKISRGHSLGQRD